MSWLKIFLTVTFVFKKPGQSFSFIAKNVKGQKVEGKATISPQTSPVGAGGAAFDLNKVAAEVASGTWKEE